MTQYCHTAGLPPCCVYGRREEPNKKETRTDKCVILVCAITDLEEITKTIKPAQQMKTFAHNGEHSVRTSRREEQQIYCHATYANALEISE